MGLRNLIGVYLLLNDRVKSARWFIRWKRKRLNSFMWNMAKKIWQRFPKFEPLKGIGYKKWIWCSGMDLYKERWCQNWRLRLTLSAIKWRKGKLIGFLNVDPIFQKGICRDRVYCGQNQVLNFGRAIDQCIGKLAMGYVLPMMWNGLQSL